MAERATHAARAWDTRTRSGRPRGTRLITTALLCLLSGCAGRSAQPSAPPGGASSGLSGQVLAASDVAGLPDRPLAEQLVLAVPLAQAGAVLGAGAQALAAEQLRFLKVQLPATHVAVSTSISDADGRYAIEVEPGDYVLCVADSQQSPPAFPATTRGCGRAAVAEGAVQQVDISSGLGEIVLLPR